jgi:hypothetical protein
MPFVPLNFISLSAIHLNFYSVSTTNIPLSQIVSVSHHLGHLGCLCPSGLMQDIWLKCKDDMSLPLASPIDAFSVSPSPFSHYTCT